MKNIKTYLIEFCRDEEGLTIVEYAIAGGLVAVGVVAAFTSLGTNVKTVISGLATETSKAAAKVPSS